MKGFVMWLLLIILLAPVPDLNRMTVLNTFTTYEACKPERDRIGFEMAESYPYENDFRIVCEFRDETPSKIPVRRLREELVFLDRSCDRLSFDSPPLTPLPISD
jgi:hypothetical protein